MLHLPITANFLHKKCHLPEIVFTRFLPPPFIQLIPIDPSAFSLRVMYPVTCFQHHVYYIWCRILLTSVSPRASLVAQLVKNPPAMPETWVQFLGWEDPLEKRKATHSVFSLSYYNISPMRHRDQVLFWGASIKNIIKKSTQHSLPKFNLSSLCVHGIVSLNCLNSICFLK